MIPRAFVMTIGLASIATCLVAQVRKDDGRSSEDRAHIIGTWELVSTEERLTNGSKRPYLDVGASGKGYLMYTADGYMCAAGMNPDRPAWQDVNKPTEAEKVRAMDGFLATAGATKSAHSIMRSITIQKLHWTRTLSEANKYGHTDLMQRY